MKKTISFSIITILFILCLSACSTDNTTTVEEITVAPVAETKNDVVTETVIDEAEEVEETTTIEWVDAYNDFLSNKENLKPALISCPGFLDAEGCKLDGFALQDLNGNGVPELIIGVSNFSGYCTDTFIYEYTDMEVNLKKEFCKANKEDCLGDLYKDDRENAYYLWLDNFGDIGVSTSLYKYGDIDELVYSNELNNDDGTIYNEKGDVSAYNDITSHLLKISYYNISDENIQNKICEGYNADEYFKQNNEEADHAEFPYTVYSKYFEEVTGVWGQKQYIDWKNYRCFYDFELDYAVNILDIDPDNIED